MAAIRREIAAIEEQYTAADEQYADISKKLRSITQERLNTEEELLAANSRLKQLLGELEVARAQAAELAAVQVQDNKMTMGELTRKVEAALMGVLDERFRDEAFTSSITEQSVLSTDKVRVEYEQDEVWWALQDNYTFEMLQKDASRYWDVAPQDAMLTDERGAIWPNDSYVGLEMHRYPTSKIKLKLKPVARQVEEDVELYGKEGEEEESDDDDDVDLSFLQVAQAAEDEILLAQARGASTQLTTKQKLALRRKLKYECYYFLFFVLCFVWSIYSRRTVKDAYYLQEAVSTAFSEENFGDYNEKTFFDIANAEEMFDWMNGPLKDGLFPDELYNGQPMPSTKKGYVMTYNKIVGKIRLRQLRVKPGAACELSPSVMQSNTRLDGTFRRRQFVDYCYDKYNKLSYSNASYGLNASLWALPNNGFTFTNETVNDLVGNVIMGQAGEYDGAGFVRDLDPESREEYERALEELQSNLWVDEQTRAVVVSLNLYNGNYNYYCISQYMIEYTKGGTIIPSATNKILNMDIYEPQDLQKTDKILLLYTPELFTILGAIAYFLNLLYKLYRAKKVTKTIKPVLRDTWNIVDVMQITTFALTYYLRLTFMLDPKRVNFYPFKTEYQEMAPFYASYSLIFTLQSVNVLLLVVKSLKYFALQKDLMLLQKTLFQALADLTFFLILLVFLFFGFILMGLNIFGMQADGFKTIQDTLGTLFLILLGEFDFQEMRDVNPTWALIFFIVFVVFMFFIVLNIFLAILNDAYTVVHTDVVWEELEKRKPMSLREKFEVKKAVWRERKNIRRMKKQKTEKVKAAKKAKKEYEKKQKEHMFLDKISRKKRAEKKRLQEEAGGADAATSTTKESGRRKLVNKFRPFG